MFFIIVEQLERSLVDRACHVQRDLRVIWGNSDRVQFQKVEVLVLLKILNE